MVLMLAAATRDALDRIVDETEMEPICATTLLPRDNLFQEECGHFNAAEKNTLLRYCERADKKHPRGYGEAGLLIVFAHRCPNDAIPILHANHTKWSGLLPRQD